MDHKGQVEEGEVAEGGAEQYRLAFVVDQRLSGKLFDHRNTIARKIGLPSKADEFVFKLVYKRCPVLFVLAQFIGCGITVPFLMELMPKELMFALYSLCIVCVAMSMLHSNVALLYLIVRSFEYFLVLTFSVIFVVCYVILFWGDPRGFAIIYIFVAVQAVILYDCRARRRPSTAAEKLDRTYIGYNLAAVFWLGVLIVIFYGGFAPGLRVSTFQVFAVSQDVLSLMLSALEAMFCLFLKFFVSSWLHPNRLVIVKAYIELSPELQEESGAVEL